MSKYNGMSSMLNFDTEDAMLFVGYFASVLVMLGLATISVIGVSFSQIVVSSIGGVALGMTVSFVIAMVSLILAVATNIYRDSRSHPGMDLFKDTNPIEVLVSGASFVFFVAYLFWQPLVDAVQSNVYTQAITAVVLIGAFAVLGAYNK